MRRAFALLLCASGLAVVSCSSRPQIVTNDSAASTTVVTDAARAWRPIQAPGALNPAVTQANIATTICKTGWTATVRPPVTYTGPLKAKLFADEHAPGKISDYELDHMVALELGGAPRDTANLWLQPWNGAQGAHAKDLAENRLRAAVCAGQLTLVEAQAEIRDPSQWHG